MSTEKGYTILILLVFVTVLAIGLLVAVPVWQTAIQRDKEEELIFRGKQYVEAIRIFQQKHPGTFPKTVEELVKGRCLRRPFPDPMTKDGKWDIIIQQQGLSRGESPKKESGTQQIFVVPQASLSSIATPRILGVVSASPKKSIHLYYDNDTYNRWLFYYGQNPNVKPEVIYFGRTKKD